MRGRTALDSIPASAHTAPFARSSHLAQRRSHRHSRRALEASDAGARHRSRYPGAQHRAHGRACAGVTASICVRTPRRTNPPRSPSARWRPARSASAAPSSARPKRWPTAGVGVDPDHLAGRDRRRHRAADGAERQDQGIDRGVRRRRGRGEGSTRRRASRQDAQGLRRHRSGHGPHRHPPRSTRRALVEQVAQRGQSRAHAACNATRARCSTWNRPTSGATRRSRR